MVAPGRWWRTALIDVRMPHDGRPPAEVLIHCGTAVVAARVRRLGDDLVRLSLARSLDLHNGDRLLIRDPGNAALSAGTVLDVDPPPLRGRGAAAARAGRLTALSALRRSGLARRADLIAMGETCDGEGVVHGEWIIDTEHHDRLVRELVVLVERYARDHPTDPGMPVLRAQRLLKLPDPALVAAVAGALKIYDGRIYAEGGTDDIPEAVARVARVFRDAVAGSLFRSPTREQLSDRGLSQAMLARAVAAGLLLKVGELHLLPDAPREAVELLAHLPQPFTVAQARIALDTNRRVAISLLEHLDAVGATRRTSEGKRCVVSPLRSP